MTDIDDRNVRNVVRYYRKRQAFPDGFPDLRNAEQKAAYRRALTDHLLRKLFG